MVFCWIQSSHRRRHMSLVDDKVTITLSPCDTERVGRDFAVLH
jgi:hypothetical protein